MVRSEVLNEFNSYLLLLIRIGNISKLASVNVRKRRNSKTVNKNMTGITKPLQKIQ